MGLAGRLAPSVPRRTVVNLRRGGRRLAAGGAQTVPAEGGRVRRTYRRPSGISGHRLPAVCRGRKACPVATPPAAEAAFGTGRPPPGTRPADARLAGAQKGAPDSGRPRGSIHTAVWPRAALRFCDRRRPSICVALCGRLQARASTARLFVSLRRAAAVRQLPGPGRAR